MTLSAISSPHESEPSPSQRADRVGRSAIQVDLVGGRSRLVRSVSQDPLKLLPTKSGDERCCSVVVSNYGGGFLQGDDAHLTVDCSADTRLYLGTQALNKVYRCPTGRARQTIEGKLGRGARVVSLPDPVMLFAESRYEQRQSWQMKPGSVLAIADGMVSGRRAMGESFEFASYSSDTRIYLNSRPVAIESARCEPGRMSHSGAAVFGSKNVTFTLMIAGSSGESCFERTVSELETCIGEGHTEEVIVAFTKPKEDVAMVRLMADSLAIADETIRRLNGCVAERMLNFDPISRKT